MVSGWIMESHFDAEAAEDAEITETMRHVGLGDDWPGLGVD
jgi:hypothetical protein